MKKRSSLKNNENSSFFSEEYAKKVLFITINHIMIVHPNAHEVGRISRCLELLISYGNNAVMVINIHKKLNIRLHFKMFDFILPKQ